MDLFICHASEDKDEFVRPLAVKLKELGVAVWYDEFSLKPGDSLSRSIERGISNCNYGVVVLSEYFINKNWPEYELQCLNAYEARGQKKIVPIWLGITPDQVIDFSPHLADKYALHGNRDNVEEIALRLLAVLQPENSRFTNRVAMMKRFVASGDVKNAQRNDISPSQVVRGRFVEYVSESQLSRIRLLRAAMYFGTPESLHSYLDGFLREIDIEQELRYWERIAACFLEVAWMANVRGQYYGDDENPFRGFFVDLYRLISEYAYGVEKPDVEHLFDEKIREIVLMNLRSPISLMDDPEKMKLDNENDPVIKTLKDSIEKHQDIMWGPAAFARVDGSE